MMQAEVETDEAGCQASNRAHRRSWNVVGASVRGEAHALDGTECQDAFAHRLEDALVVVCVCDGAGSARYAREGALTASSALAAHVAASASRCESTLTEHVHEACVAARESLVARAVELDCELADLACTVVGAVARDGALLVWQIGDGGVVAQTEAGAIALLSAPAGGEYANETYFLTSASWEKHLRVSEHVGIRTFAAFSDGCEAASLVAGPPLAPFEDFWRAVFDFLDTVQGSAQDDDEIRALLDGKRVRATSKDDKTLVLVTGRRLLPEP